MSVTSVIKYLVSETLTARLSGGAHRKVRLGIRPEDVDEKGVPAEERALRGTVNSVLPVGSDQYLGLQFGKEELFFRVGKDLAHRTGENVALSVDVNRLHFFDPETGNSLLSPRAAA